MAIRVRSTFPPSQRTRRGIEPFVAGNDDRRGRRNGMGKGEGEGEEEGGRAAVPLPKKILLWVASPKLPRMRGGKKVCERKRRSSGMKWSE